MLANVTEVAHDCVVALKNWFQSRGIRSSFDTWHGRFIRGQLVIDIASFVYFSNLIRIYEHCKISFVYCLLLTIGTKGVAKEMKKSAVVHSETKE